MDQMGSKTKIIWHLHEIKEKTMIQRHKTFGIIYIIIGCLCLYGNIHQFIDASQPKIFFYSHIPLNILIIIIGIILVKFTNQTSINTINTILIKTNLLLDNIDNIIKCLDSLEIICNKNQTKISKTFIVKLNYLHKHIGNIIYEFNSMDNRNFDELVSNLKHYRARLEENIDRIKNFNRVGNFFNDTK